MLRAAFVSVVLAVVAALFAPQSSAGLFFSGVAVAFILHAFGMRDGTIAAMTFLPGPLVLHAFNFPFLVRLLFTLLYGSLFLWALSDIQLRQKGGAVHLGRLELFLYSGVFGISAVLFTGIDVTQFPAPIFLVGSAAAAFLAVYFLRSFAERSRATQQALVSPVLDAYFLAVLFVEAFVALSFLPFSSLTLAAVLTMFLWAATALLIAARTGRFRKRYLLRVAMITAVLLVALFVAVPWRTLL